MPYANEHAARLQDPEKYERFTRENDKFGSGIHAIWGILKDGKVELQAIRFDKEKFTVEEAKKWCAGHNHKPMEFEPASEEKKSESQSHGFLKCAFDVDLKCAADGENKLPSFSLNAYNGGLMDVGWGFPVIVDLAGMSFTKKPRPVLKDHDTSKVVGHTETIENTGKSLLISGVVSGVNEHTKEIIANSKNGFPWQVSIGAEVKKAFLLQEEKTAHVNGQEITGPCYIVKKSALAEVSFVALGADDTTAAKVAAAKILNAIAKETLEMANETNTPAPVPAPAEDRAAQDAVKLETERKRVGELVKVSAGRTALLEKAIAAGWTVEKLESAVNKEELAELKAKLPTTAPAAHVHKDEDLTNDVLTCAVLQATKASNVKFDDKVMAEAHKRFKGQIGLGELFLEAARANGYTGSPSFKRNHREVLEYAFGHVKAGFSSIDISGILAATANKFLLEGFYAVEDSWRKITAVKSVVDFKTITSYRMTGLDQYDLLPPGGEIHHGKLEEESYTNKADTYARMFGLTRTAQINDDLGALNSIPRKLGRGAGLKINDIFWTAFMDNSTFFTGARANYTSGATTALSIASLSAVETLFMNMVDADSKPIGATPRILLVPTALGPTANQLTRSLEVRSTEALTSGGGQFGTFNPHAGKFDVVVSRYLSNTGYTGYSAVAWYLLAAAADIPVIETVFLNGQEAPTIESADTDFNTLGILFRGYHDFGVTKQDYRGGVMSKGSA